MNNPMKDFVILCIVVFAVGSLVIYLLPEQKVYYKHFQYNTDDFADDYHGMFTVDISESLLTVQDTTDDVLIFHRTKEGLWREDGAHVAYELIQNDVILVLRGPNESLVFSGLTYIDE